MFLTRLGFGSKMVVTGDVTQVDLPKGKQSGLRVSGAGLKLVEEIQFVRLTESDVVRHTLVQKVIDVNPTSKRERSFDAIRSWSYVE